jgi:hypothetical protein
MMAAVPAAMAIAAMPATVAASAVDAASMAAAAVAAASMITGMESGAGTKAAAVTVAIAAAPAMPAIFATPAQALTKAKTAPVPAGAMPTINIPAVMAAAPDIELDRLEHHLFAGVNAGDQLRIGPTRIGASKKHNTGCTQKNLSHGNPTCWLRVSTL